tara:strand:+ start:53 stop:871 length:819 start_codon:yes stop_codon:yes gene_type:complete
MKNFKITDCRNKKTPKVSVIVSFYKEKKILNKSLQSLIKQTFKDFEIILLSDGAEEETIKIAKKFVNKKNNVLYFESKKNLGLTKMLNIGLKYSRGTFLARHDSDDVSAISRFEKQVKFLNKNNHFDIIGSNAVYLNKKNKINIQMPETDEQIKKKLIFKNTIIHSSVMMRKRIFKNISYNEKFKRCQDYELWLRLRSRFMFYNIQKNLVIRHNTSKKFLFSELILTSKARFKHLGLIVSIIIFLKDLSVYFFKNSQTNLRYISQTALRILR